MSYKLEISSITGVDIALFNATIDAFRCNTYTNFVYHYGEKLRDFFKNVEITIDKDTYILCDYYENATHKLLAEVFDDIMSYRKTELAFLFEEKEKTFNDLSNIEKIRYKLLYNYGEKLGGYAQIASLTIEELLSINKYFVDLANLENEQTKQYLEKNKGI